MSDELFPIMCGEQVASHKSWIPWAVIAPHEAQAQHNHSQTLQQLAERGGLSPCEAVAVIEDRSYGRMPEHEARYRLGQLVARFYASRSDAGGGRAELRQLRNRVIAIRDEATKPRPSSDFNIGWQLGRLIDDFDNLIGGESTHLPALSSPPVGEGVREAQLLDLVVKWRTECTMTRAELGPGGIREYHQEGPRYGIAAVEACADELDALLTSGVREAPAETSADTARLDHLTRWLLEHPTSQWIFYGRDPRGPRGVLDHHRRGATREAPAEPQARGWQPIETAPKDGTLVLLSNANDSDWALRCRRWQGSADNGNWRGFDGHEATHWMPLPAPPVPALAPADKEQE